jgi:prepilin-type N-terminal cleavage/methylation domain-containing protein
MTDEKGFTLIELVVVMVIIGIFATISFTHYVSAREKVLDKEAVSNLKLIRDGERICKVETGSYYPSSGSVTDIGTINTNLSLMLPTGSDRYLNYAVWSTGCARATRNGSDSRSWYLAITVEDPVSGAGCP